MFFYLYDSFLTNKKYEKLLHQIEARGTDLGINGKIGKLNFLNNIKELVEDAIKWGSRTIIAVGNDKTVSQLVDIVPRFPKVTLGIIPIGPDNNIAQSLGIPTGELACDVLSNRLIDILDLGKINEHFFLCSVRINRQDIALECDKHYRIVPRLKNQQIAICNFGYFFKQKTNPKDGTLETIVARPPTGFTSVFKKNNYLRDSLFLTKTINVSRVPKRSEEKREITLLVDECRIVKTPAIVEVVPHKLKVIVGKERRF